MQATWGKWFTLLIIAFVFLFACDWYAQGHLGSWYDLLGNFIAFDESYTDAGEDDSSSCDGYFWYKAVEAMTEYVYPPWPIREDARSSRMHRFDPNAPDTTDPEVILGLALLPLEPNILGLWTWNVMHNDQSPEADRLRQFRRLAALAVQMASGPEQRCQLEQIILSTEDVMPLAGIPEFWLPVVPFELPGQVTTQPAVQPALTAQQFLAATEEGAAARPAMQTQLDKYILDRARTIDPHNAIYTFRAIRGEALAVMRDNQDPDYRSAVLPSESSAAEWELTDPEALLSAARSIDAIMSSSSDETNCRMFAEYRRHLVKKAMMYRQGETLPASLVQFAATMRVDHFLASLTLSMWRDVTKRLCFLGDRLAERGHAELALNMYGHAYRLGRQLAGGDPDDRNLLHVLVGLSCISRAQACLVEFWARRGNAEKACAASTLTYAVQQVYSTIRTKNARGGADPLGDNDVRYVYYTRTAGLTWWLGYTAVVMAGISGLAALGWTILRRSIGAIESSLERGRSVGSVVLWPILAMVWLGLIVPLRLDRLESLCVIMCWALILTFGWIVFVAMWVSRPLDDGAKSSSGPRVVWLSMGLGMLLVITVSSMVGEAAGVVAAVVVIVLGTIAWISTAIVSWRREQAKPRRAERLQFVKGFAVASMFAAAACAVVCLMSMPLTAYGQDAYLDSAARDMSTEVRRYLGRGWSCPRLPDEMFTLEPLSRD